MRPLTLSLAAVLFFASAAAADPIDPSVVALAAFPGAPPQISGPSCAGDAALSARALLVANPRVLFQQDSAQPLHTAAIEHSDAYHTRAKIHKYASYAMLPLFVTEVALGQSLYNGSGDGGQRGAHAAVGAGIVGLFAVNTVTGAWNMFGEGRQEKEGRTLRLVHGLLMMAADVGFVATSMSAPENEHEGTASSFESNKATHRNLALGSMSVATAGYLIMLFGNH